MIAHLILQTLHLKAESSFSEEEEGKLEAAFFSRQDHHLVPDTTSFLLEQHVTLDSQQLHSSRWKTLLINKTKQKHLPVLGLPQAEKQSKNSARGVLLPTS